MFTYKAQKLKAFTLIELLVTIALIGMVSAIGAPIYARFLYENDLDIAQTAVVRELRRAQLLSQSGRGDATWGIRIDTGNITIFKGNSYASRITTSDETFNLPSKVSVSGNQEYIFSKFYGEPNLTGQTNLRGQNNKVRNINLNAKGIINY